MKLILVVLLCYLLTVAVKSEEPVETAYEDPEDELDELEEWELDDPVMDKPTSDEVATEHLVHCLMKNRGAMKKDCLRQFRPMIPPDHRDKVYSCVRGLVTGGICKKGDMDEFKKCLMAIKRCVMGEEGIEGSGENWF